jgi:hypothetical protein
MGMRQTKARLGSIILMLAISIPAGGNEAGRSTPMSEFVPLEIHGWRAKGKDTIYSRQSIFDYMNGAGEIYRLYGFRELFVRRFVKAGQPDIVLEMFDMGSPEDAFGVLSHGREGQGEDVGIGRDSEYDRGLLFFWKGRFYISIYAVRETSSAKRAVLNIGGTISRAIAVQGEKPKLIDYLPTHGLMEESIRYFHNHLSLNLHYFVADENILYLDDRTKAVLARYQHKGAKTYLLLIQYQTPKKAKAALRNFIRAYIPEAKRTGIAQVENGRWSAATVEHVFVIAVFDASTMAHAGTIIKAAMERLEAKGP